MNVDATAPGSPLEPVWAFFGYDEANYTTSREGRDLLATLASLADTPVRVRTHFLFNTGDGTPSLKWGSTNLYTEDESGSPVYSYDIIDPIMAATIDAGAFPLFEIGFMPHALSTRPDPYENSGTYVLDSGAFYPPKDYDKWGELVETWARHVATLYAGTQSNWIWELWNEPDIGYWRGTAEEYARLYDHTEAALHSVLPDAPLGAPAVARPDGTFLSEFLTHCELGTNAVTGETGTRLDVVSFHAKGGVVLSERHVRMDLGNHLRLHRAGFEAVAASSAFARTPIVISEADPDGCAACPVRTAPHHAYRTSPAYGAYEVALMKRSLDLADEVGVDLRGVLTWAFTFPETPYFAGYRALATNGIHLPVLNAFKLLARVQGDRLPASSSGARTSSDLIESGVRDVPDVDALAARNGDEIQILVWNYHDDLVDADDTRVTVDVAVSSEYAQGATVTHRRVDHAHGDAFTVWQSQGSPATPSATQLAELHAAMESSTFEPQRVVEVSDGVVTLSFDLPRFGVSLLSLGPYRSGAHDETLAARGGCECRAAVASARTPAVLTLLLAVALIRRRAGQAPRRGHVVPPTRSSFGPRAATNERGRECRT